MKKILNLSRILRIAAIPLFAAIFCNMNVHAETIFFESELFSEKEKFYNFESFTWDEWNNALTNLSLWAATNSIEFKPYEEKNYVDFENNEDLLSTLEDQKERLIEFHEMISNNLLDVICENGKSYEEELREIDEKIARAKELNTQKDDSPSSYPRLYLHINEYPESDGYNFEINCQFQISESDKTFQNQLIFRFEKNRKDNQKKSQIIENYLKEVIQVYLNKKKAKYTKTLDANLLPLDSFSIPSGNIQIAALQNHQFAMNYKNSLEIREANLESLCKIDNSDISDALQIDSNGKDVLHCSFPNKNQVKTFDCFGNTISTKNFIFGTSNSKVSFSKEGQPIFTSFFPKIEHFIPKENETSTTKLNIPQYSTNVLSGNNQTIWIKTGNGIFIYSMNGELLKTKITDFSQTPENLVYIFDDDSFLTASVNQIKKYSKDSIPLWQYDFPGEDSVILFKTYADGIYYVADTKKMVLMRLCDPEKKLSPVLESLRQIRRNADKNERTYQIKKNIADSFYEYGGFHAAFANYSEYMQWCPADAATNDKKIKTEIKLLTMDSKSLIQKTLDVLDEYGEETARPYYQEAMKNLEKLKKISPWDIEVQKMTNELKQAFNPQSEFSALVIPNLEIQEIQIAVLFPALMNVYSTENPSGKILVKNKGKTPLKNLKVSAYIRRFMDFPSFGKTIPQIQDEGWLDIVTTLNDSVLNLNENTILQMQLTIYWDEEGKTNQISVTRPVTMYKKSAISWADTRMLGAFILPNDSTVQSFAFSHIENKSIGLLLSSNFKKAMLLSNALGSIPLNYVSDPAASFSSIIENQYAVDTVRFPAETLEKKGGDCDDMTTLFCSTLESAGIPTALITTPGHIFAAFDTNCKPNDVWDKISSQTPYLIIDETIWIPIETTVLSKGFMEAWKTAGKTLERYPDDYEINRVSQAKSIYPGVPFTSSIPAPDIQMATCSLLNEKSTSWIKDLFIKSAEESKKENGSAKNLNLIAKIYHSIGYDDQAIDILTQAVKIDANYAAASANLAKLYELKGKTDLSNEFYKKALEQGFNQTQFVQSNQKTSESRADDLDENFWNE